MLSNHTPHMAVSFAEKPVGVTTTKHTTVEDGVQISRWLHPHVTVPVLGTDEALTLTPNRYGRGADEIDFRGGPRSWSDHSWGWYSPHVPVDAMRDMVSSSVFGGDMMSRAVTVHAGFNLAFTMCPATFKPGRLRRERPALRLHVARSFDQVAKTGEKTGIVTVRWSESSFDPQAVLVDPDVFAARVTALLDAMKSGQWVEDPMSKGNQRANERARAQADMLPAGLA